MFWIKNLKKPNRNILYGFSNITKATWSQKKKEFQVELIYYYHEKLFLTDCFLSFCNQ